MSKPDHDFHTTEWHPTRLFLSSPAEKNTALIILNQPLRDIRTLERTWANSSFHIAADGGANRLYDVKDQGAEPSSFDNLDVIIGDLDSLAPAARSYYTAASPSLQIIHDEDQYSTDFTKAVRHIRTRAAAAGGDGSQQPVNIVAMGGLGGRVDQGLSQLHHLYMFQTSPTYSDGRVYLVSGSSLTFLLKTGRHVIHVREPAEVSSAGGSGGGGGGREELFDKYAGIVPIKEPSVITLKGFEWDVEDWTTEIGGLVSTSNHVLPESEVVEVVTSKDVIFTIALKPREET
ncbi:putative thiamine pyrophosphokinase [Xylariales sp. PMI_506]|nr:putative thiamine pyrophosphokinase [Xylariales sp. PMI_506]